MGEPHQDPCRISTRARAAIARRGGSRYSPAGAKRRFALKDLAGGLRVWRSQTRSRVRNRRAHVPVRRKAISPQAGAWHDVYDRWLDRRRSSRKHSQSSGDQAARSEVTMARISSPAGDTSQPRSDARHDGVPDGPPPERRHRQEEQKAEKGGTHCEHGKRYDVSGNTGRYVLTGRLGYQRVRARGCAECLPHESSC